MRIVVEQMPEENYQCPYCKDESCMDYKKYTCQYNGSGINCWNVSECPFFISFKDMFENEIVDYDCHPKDFYGEW